MITTIIYRKTFDPTKDHLELKLFEASKTEDWKRVALSTTAITYEHRVDIFSEAEE